MNIGENKYKRGFTIVELLVVVSIISLLASVVLGSLTTARMKGRDARRMEDIHQIQLALSLYYSDNGHYPSGGWYYSCNGTWSGLQAILAPYISSLPVDPVNTSCNGPWNVGYFTYSYGSTGGDKYDLVGALETTGSAYACASRKYLFHDWGGEAIWCTGGFGYWDQMYADH